MARDATKEEMKWWSKLIKLIDKMPKTMTLFADGRLVAVDTNDIKNYYLDNIEHFQPIDNLYGIPGVDGGDPWN